MKKKPIIIIALFGVIFIMAFYIFNAFFYSNLKFKEYVQIDKEIKSCTLLYNDNVAYTIDNGKDVEVYTISNDNANPKKMLTISNEEEIYNYYFTEKNNYYYFIYNNNKGIKTIDKNTKEVIDYQSNGNIIIINEYNDDILNYENNILISIINNQKYIIDSRIDKIKEIEFYSANKACIFTYDNYIYYYDFTNNSFIKNEDNIYYYIIKGQSLYYCYYEDNKLIFKQINLNTLTEEKNFKVKQISFNMLKIVDDYIYLIGSNEISLVSISREKTNETLKMQSYDNSLSYDLNNVLIVNEKLMFIPIYSYKFDYTNNNSEYTYYIYRYKK